MTIGRLHYTPEPVKVARKPRSLRFILAAVLCCAAWGAAQWAAQRYDQVEQERLVQLRVQAYAAGYAAAAQAGCGAPALASPLLEGGE